jgi:hypothetical protein
MTRWLKLAMECSPRRKFSMRGQWLAYLGCSFAVGVFSAFNNFALTLWLAGFTSSYVLLGMIGNSKSFEGAIVVLNIPLLADLVPRHHTGTASGSLAAPIASLVAGGLADAFGPRAIFGLMAVTIAIALSLMPGVRPPAETRSTSILE